MDPVFMFPASPGTPLFPVSPERANRQHLPQSPSIPSELSHLQHDPFITAHSRGSSDVQGKVAQFNTLSKEAAQRRRDNEASLKRAVLGREEAESETRRMREENRVLRREIEEGRARERRVGERVEGVMEELQRAKETHAHSQVLYEKEVRRARKEAFKSSSALVKLQEELKSTRNKFTLMREEVEVQRRKVDCKDQETFTAQYQLVGLQEDMDALRRQMKTTEDEREVLKTNLREEEIARIAAEGMIALPISREGDEFASPKKKKTPKKRGSLKENQDPELSDEDDELLVLKKQLKIEMRLRKNAHDQIDFMKMECQYQCCSCRVAEKQGKDYIHDGSVAEAVTQMSSMSHDDRVTTPRRTSPAISATPIATPTQRSPPQRPQDTESLINFSPSTGTFYTTPSTAKEHPSLFRQPSEQSPTTNPNTPCRSSKNTTPTITNIPQPPPPTFNLFPSTPQPHPHTTSTTSTTTTTTLIPLAPLASPTAPPSSISREQALEQIRQRRGRARSVAAGTATPRKLMAGSGVGERRDLSAPQSVGRRW